MSGSKTRASLILTILFLSLQADPSHAVAASRETPLVKAVQQCRQSVVNINTERYTADDKEPRSFGQKPRKVTGMGTGIIVDERGYIVTNYHVIQDVDRIFVTMDDGATFDGRPVSFDRRKDLAIIRIDAGEPLTVMPMGTSSDLMLAETVFAVGNAYGYEHTITSGIVSALNRDVEVDETQSYENLIQTDASINPGNSGGPLLNLDGEVVGINVAIRAGAQRIGFAIPIDDARRSIARLMSVERLNGMPHGLTTTDMKSHRDHRLVVDSVASGSSSEKCGVKPGDIILSVRGLTIHDGTDLERSLLDLNPGEAVDLVLQRDGSRQSLKYIAGAASSTITAGSVATDVDSKATASVTTVALPESSSVNVAGPSEKAEKKSAATGDAVLTQVWELFGLRLMPLSDREAAQVRGGFYGATRYNGGMKVASVRNSSLASRHGIRTGDILVGMDGFETLSPENIGFIIGEERLRNTTSLSFLIVRPGNSVPLQGKLDLTGVRVSSTTQTPAQ